MTSPTSPPDAVPTADPGPPPSAPAGMPTASERFFAWVRGLGIVRVDGWLGGVCGGIAARLRIDPIIVRGIVVVATVLGLPMFLLYAIAWALLPDVQGRIHLQELFRGRWEPAMTGIAILALLTIVPVLPWLTNLLLWPLWGSLSGGGYPGGGLQYGWDLLPSWLTLFLGWATALAVIAGIVFLIVRSARRGRIPRADSDPRTASADLAAPGFVGTPSSGEGAPTPSGAEQIAFADGQTDAATAAPAADAPPLEPPAPSGPASDADVAAWRAQHQAWREQNEAWRRQQQDAGRAAREQARREREAAGAVFAAEAAERRRIRRLTAPRTSGAYVWFVLGAALVTGAATALWGSADAGAEFAPALGVFASALVVAVAMVVAGIMRRRSGFLAAVAILLLLIGAGGTATAAVRGVIVGDYGINNLSPRDEAVIQAWGNLDITLFERGAPSDPIVVNKQAGYTSIFVDPGVELSLSVESGSGMVQFVAIDPDTDEYREQAVDQQRSVADDGWSIETTITSGDGPATTRQRVELDQRSGGVTVYFTLPRETETTP